MLWVKCGVASFAPERFVHPARQLLGTLISGTWIFGIGFSSPPVPKPHRDPGTINEINLLQGLREPHNTRGDSQTALFKQKPPRETFKILFKSSRVEKTDLFVHGL